MWWPWRSLGVFVHLHPEVGGRGHGINLWYQAAEVAKFSSAELQLVVGSTYKTTTSFICLTELRIPTRSRSSQ